MNGLTLFAGGAIADLGLKKAGINTIVAIEREEWIAQNAKLNFPETWVIDNDALAVNYDDLKRFNINFIWASPPCQGFSMARSKTLPEHQDINAGWAIIKAVTALNPQYLAIENVPQYLKSDIYQRIRNELLSLGYWVSETIINAADFGVPQNRKRLIVRACKNGFIGELKGNGKAIGWHEAIADLIPSMSPTKLTDWQKRRLNSIGAQLIDWNLLGYFNENSSSYLLPRIGCDFRRDYKPIPSDLPCPTLRALGHDRHWRQFDVWDGIEVRKLSIEGEMRLQSIPDNYQWLPTLKNWQKKRIIGNGVPPLLSEFVVKSFA